MTSPEFVRKRATMRELQILLDNRRSQPGNAIFPVLYGYNVEQCWDFNTFRALYDTELWVGGEDMPDDSVLDAWAKNVNELCEYCGVRQDQASDCGPYEAARRSKDRFTST